jgi:hypothetical protein
MINEIKEITMIIAYRISRRSRQCFLSPLYYEADKNNPGNHCNPMNHSSDNNRGSASAQFNESAAIQLRQKIILAIIVIP